jgi:hypothetical protein
MKQKPKELDWEKELRNVIETAASVDDCDDIECGIRYVRGLLTQQRTELKEIIDLMWDKKEKDKNRYSVGWNSALAELEARLKIKENK